MKRTKSIRSRLILLVAACVLPASLMLAGFISYSYREKRAALTEGALSTARAMISGVDRELAGIGASLIALATSPSLAHDDLSAFYDQAKEVLKAQVTNSIFLLDPTFQQRLNTLIPFGSDPPSRVNSGLREVFRTGNPVTTGIFFAPISKVPLIAIGVPVWREGKVIYVLGASILPETLAKILAGQRLSAGWIAVILDSSGTIVARTHLMERFVGAKAAPAVVARAGEVEEGTLDVTSVEGIPIMTAFSKSAVSNWTVAIGIPQRSLSIQLWQTLAWLVAGTIVLLAGSLAVAWKIKRQIAGPIRQLVKPALAVGFGGAVTVPHLNLTEADDVGRALTRASTMLRTANYKASHDVLTGLANRALFNEILNHQIAVCRRTKSSLSVIYVDLDGFKPVNDKYGHATGDEILCMVATRLKNAIRESDLAARLGGDEFALILINAGVAAARTVGTKLTSSLCAPYDLDARSLNLSASIGIAVYPESGRTSEALCRFADEAMYLAKAVGERKFALET